MVSKPAGMFVAALLFAACPSSSRAETWRIAALAGNRSAPALLARQYFTTAMKPAERQVDRGDAIKAVFWGTIGARIDPDAAMRSKSQKLVGMVLGIAPDVRTDTESLLAARRPPPE